MDELDEDSYDFLADVLETLRDDSPGNETRTSAAAALAAWLANRRPESRRDSEGMETPYELRIAGLTGSGLHDAVAIVRQKLKSILPGLMRWAQATWHWVVAGLMSLSVVWAMSSSAMLAEQSSFVDHSHPIIGWVGQAASDLEHVVVHQGIWVGWSSRRVIRMRSRMDCSTLLAICPRVDAGCCSENAA